MGPFTPAAAEWMWAAITLVMSSTSIVYVTVVPSEMYCTRPLAAVLRAGTSLEGDRVASKTSIPSVPFVHPPETKPMTANKAPAEARASVLRCITHLHVGKEGLAARRMERLFSTLAREQLPCPRANRCRATQARGGRLRRR